MPQRPFQYALMLEPSSISRSPLASDPEFWFVVRPHGMVAKTSEESIVPCVVINPNITVSLYEMDTHKFITGRYIPGEGYRAHLEDRTYVCHGQLNGELRESQSFDVFSITGRRAAPGTAQFDHSDLTQACYFTIVYHYCFPPSA